MPIRTGDNALDASALAVLRGLISPGDNGGGVLGSTSVIREAAVHDFSSYQFYLEPYRLRFTPPDGDDVLDDYEQPQVPLDVWTDFARFVKQFHSHITARMTQWAAERVTRWIEVDNEYVRELPMEAVLPRRRFVRRAISIQDAFRLGMAPALYERYTATVEAERFLRTAALTVQAWLAAQLEAMRGAGGTLDERDVRHLEDPSFWQAGVQDVLDAMGVFQPVSDGDDASTDPPYEEPLPPEYDFEPFLPESVNFGLQIIHRQNWVPLGTQPGEIVRTLPLGPKQVEKVTVKAVRRTKATRQAEIVTSIETATESSAATKDSSEVVQEASESFNWHTEASASASWGFGNASLSGSMGGENAASSRDTKSTLNETMEKTASKIRKDIKIVVSTEVEESTEFTQVSEISNPNDEIAVTYVYSRLQRQYEINTFLSEVNTVVFVAEWIPAPQEIDHAWIRRYDWILARELLDESFRADLEAVRSHDPGPVGVESVDANIQSLMETFSGAGLPDYATMSGQPPDLLQNPQQAYEREVERRRARESDREQYQRSLRRLRTHLYDNILHYCRAIWAAEDPDARLMRYAKMRVPINWEFVPNGPQNGHLLPGHYAPAVYDYAADTVPLSEIINPAGPIGFAGNYAIYYLKESDRWASLIQALGQQQLPFLRLQATVEPDGATGDLEMWGYASDNRLGEGNYRLVFESSPDPRFRIWHQEAGVYKEIDPVPVVQGRPLQFHAIRVWIEPQAELNPGDAFWVRVSILPQLEDPELKAFRWRMGRLDPADEAAFYTGEVIAEFAEFFSDVQEALRIRDAGVTDWGGLSEETRDLLRSRYFHYLMRKRHTRRLLVDTNNVILTREVDGFSTIEPFKGLHRLADVLDAYADLQTKQLENQRRLDRLAVSQLGDPDIEKVTLVAAADGLGSLGLIDGLTDEPEPEDDGS